MAQCHRGRTDGLRPLNIHEIFEGQCFGGDPRRHMNASALEFLEATPFMIALTNRHHK